MVPLAVHEAVLGARIERAVDRWPGEAPHPSRDPGGRRLRVSGRGCPAATGQRGDLIVEVQLVLPEIVDERSKELMREFGTHQRGGCQDRN